MQIPLIEDNMEIAEVGCPGQDFSLFCRSEGHVELQWCVRSPERKCGLAHIGACDEGISNGCFDEGEFRLGMRNHTESGTRIDLHFQLRNTVLVTCRTLVDVGEGKSIWVYSKPVLISTPSNDEEALAETCQPLADDKISPLTTELASTSAVESSPSPSPTKTYNAASSTSLASPTEMPNVPTTNPAASCLPCPISCKCPENCPISGKIKSLVIFVVVLFAKCLFDC